MTECHVEMPSAFAPNVMAETAVKAMSNPSNVKCVTVQTHLSLADCHLIRILL
jgi:hypothetical protein